MAARKYSDDFKLDAVRRVVLDGERVADVADDLGIAKPMLYRWRRELDEVVAIEAAHADADAPEKEQPEPDEPEDVEEVDADFEVRVVGPGQPAFAPAEEPEPPPKVWELFALENLLEKLPDFTVAWPELDRVNWFNSFNAVAQLALKLENARPASTFYPTNTSGGLFGGATKSIEEHKPLEQEDDRHQGSDLPGVQGKGTDDAGADRSPVTLSLVATIQDLVRALTTPTVTHINQKASLWDINQASRAARKAATADHAPQGFGQDFGGQGGGRVRGDGPGHPAHDAAALQIAETSERGAASSAPGDAELEQGDGLDSALDDCRPSLPGSPGDDAGGPNGSSDGSDDDDGAAGALSGKKTHFLSSSTALISTCGLVRPGRGARTTHDPEEVTCLKCTDLITADARTPA